MKHTIIGAANLSCWRSAVGNLIESVWLWTNGVNTNGVTAKALFVDGFEQVLKNTCLGHDAILHATKPNQTVYLAQTNLSQTSIYWYMRDTQRGPDSSNSRFQTILFQQYSANLSQSQCVHIRARASNRKARTRAWTRP